MVQGSGYVLEDLASRLPTDGILIVGISLYKLPRRRFFVAVYALCKLLINQAIDQ